MVSDYTYGSLLTRLLRSWRFSVIMPWIPEGAIVLDLGCGIWARMEEQIKNYDLYVGLDLNHSKKYQNAKRFFVKCDLTKKWPNQIMKKKYREVLILALLEHVKNPEMVIEQTSKVLEQEGIVIITTPNGSSLARLLHDLAAKLRLLSHNAAEQHERFLTREDLETIVGKVELKVIHYQTFMLGLNQLVVAKK